MCVITLNQVKIEIIQDLLYKCVKNLYDKYYDEYSDCIKCDIDFDDGIMFIRLEGKYKESDFKDKYIFQIYLEDFERKCNSFLKKIEKQVCVNHINLIYDFHEYDSDWVDGVYYEFCEIGFEIELNGKCYNLDYVNMDL